MSSSGAPQRSVTPPKITAHKPPKPPGPPPPRRQQQSEAAALDAAALSSYLHGGGADFSSPAVAPSKAGYLVKEGAVAMMGMAKSWKRRYFSLDAGSLRYWADDNAHNTGADCIGNNVIAVCDYAVLTGAAAGDGADIVLQPLAAAGGPASGPSGGAGGSGRTWRFRCEGRADAKAWAEALEAHGARGGLPTAATPTAEG
jgi:hypothetical protein